MRGGAGKPGSPLPTLRIWAARRSCCTRARSASMAARCSSAACIDSQSRLLRGRLAPVGGRAGRVAVNARVRAGALCAECV
jgi:hypothetical protein